MFKFWEKINSELEKVLISTFETIGEVNVNTVSTKLQSMSENYIDIKLIRFLPFQICLLILATVSSDELRVIYIITILVYFLIIDLIKEFIFPRIMLFIPFMAIFSSVTHNLYSSFLLTSTILIIATFFQKDSEYGITLKGYLVFSFPTYFILSLGFRSGIDGLSVFMNGDGRNHVLILRNIIMNEYVSNNQQISYPSHTYLLPAVFSKVQDLPLAIISNASALASGYFLGSLLLVNIVYKQVTKIGIHKCKHLFLIGMCIPSSGILGFILLNGFYTTLWGLVTLSSFLLVSMNSINFSILKLSAIGLIYANLLYGTWALLAPIPILWIVLNAYHKRDWSLRISDFVYSFIAIAYSLLSLAPSLEVETQSQIFEIMSMEGGITALNKPLAILMWIYAIYSIRNSEIRISLYAVLGSATIIFIIVAVLRTQRDRHYLGYYNEKILWIAAASLLPIATAEFLLKSSTQISKRKIFTPLVVLVVMGSLGNFQLAQIRMTLGDWGGPSGLVANEVFKSDSKIPKIFWHFQDPGNDRIGTFWASIPDNPIGDKIDFSVIAAWAYTQTGGIGDLCNLLKIESREIEILTKNPNDLSVQLAKECPSLNNYKFVVSEK